MYKSTRNCDLSKAIQFLKIVQLLNRLLFKVGTIGPRVLFKPVIGEISDASIFRVKDTIRPDVHKALSSDFARCTQRNC